MELGRRAEIRPLRLTATDTGLSRELGADGPLVARTQVDLLAWLSGRTSGAGLSAEGAETVPPASYWI